MSAVAVQAQSLGRRFGELEAVRDVSFAVAEGEAFGFLGPNGAGKSTTINILCTLLRPTSGSARIAGLDVMQQPLQVRQQIGLVFQDTTLDDYLTAAEKPALSRGAVWSRSGRARAATRWRLGDGRAGGAL